MYDVAIIGAGITGCSIAYELGKYNVKAVIIEKENDVSVGTTKANSAIIHGGYDPKPGTQMAKYNIKGNVYTKELCEKLDVPYKQIGALVVAFSEEEKKTLEELKQRGITNGVPDMEIWDKEKLLKEEPNLSDKAVAALSSPNVGIVSPWELALALAETAVLNGVEVKLNTKVSGIENENDTYKIETNNGVIEAKYICNAAGVFADKVNEMCNEKTFEITPNKGEYYLMDKSQGNLVNHVIFQCPNEKGKGVLVAPTVHGNLIVGPDSQPSAADDVSTTKQGLDFVRNTALKSVPGINFRESIRNFAGVRARTADHDFHIYEDKNNKGFINIAGMQSPGLSSACAIAPDILKMLENSGLTLEAKEDIVDERHIDRFKHLSHEDRAKLVEKNPAFGKIICRCETITEGEIINAVHRPIPATSIDAVKRRCNAGMGRCQGGFCGPRVQEIIARELDPHDSCVITVGTFHAGTAMNIIPETARLAGTLRADTKEAQTKLVQRVREVTQATAAVYGATADIEISAGGPPLICDPATTDDFVKYMKELDLPGAMECPNISASASEDFAFVAERVPSAFMYLSSGYMDERGNYSAHNPKVQFNEEVLPRGAAYLAQCAQRWLEEHH